MRLADDLMIAHIHRDASTMSAISVCASRAVEWWGKVKSLVAIGTASPIRTLYGAHHLCPRIA